MSTICIHTCFCRSQSQLWWQHLICLSSPDPVYSRQSDVRLLQPVVLWKAKVKWIIGETAPQKTQQHGENPVLYCRRIKPSFCKAMFTETFVTNLQQTWNVSRKFAVFCFSAIRKIMQIIFFAFKQGPCSQ